MTIVLFFKSLSELVLKTIEVSFINGVALELDYVLTINSYSMERKFLFDSITKESLKPINSSSIIMTKSKEK